MRAKSWKFASQENTIPARGQRSFHRQNERITAGKATKNTAGSVGRPIHGASVRVSKPVQRNPSKSVFLEMNHSINKTRPVSAERMIPSRSPAAGRKDCRTTDLVGL